MSSIKMMVISQKGGIPFYHYKNIFSYAEVRLLFFIYGYEANIYIYMMLTNSSSSDIQFPIKDKTLQVADMIYVLQSSSYETYV